VKTLAVCQGHDAGMWCVPGGVHAVFHLLQPILPAQRFPAAQERHTALVDLVGPQPFAHTLH